jgi:hypothetical protein
VFRVNYVSTVLLWLNEDIPWQSWTQQIHLLDLLWIWRYEFVGLVLFAAAVVAFSGLAMRGANSAPRSTGNDPTTARRAK